MVVVLHKILVKCSNSCCSSVHHSTSGANEGGSGNAYDDRDLKQTSKNSKECQILAHVTEAPKKKKINESSLFTHHSDDIFHSKTTCICK